MHQYLAGADGLYNETPFAQKGTKGNPGSGGGKGEVGERGPKGVAGLDARITEIRYAFSVKRPDDLPYNGAFDIDWDAPRSPITTLQFKFGECVVYQGDNSVWMYLPGSCNLNWMQICVATGAITGLVGADGNKGDVGSKGEAGADGFDGSPGLTGIAGADGSKGEMGRRGYEGPYGAQGLKGDSGINGTKGEVGATGQAGTDGTDGTNGIPGAKGADGDKGQAGLGQKGDKGNDNVQLVPAYSIAYDGTGDSVISSYNASQTVRLSEGTYRFRFNSLIGDGNYIVQATACQMGPGGYPLHTYVLRAEQRFVTIVVADHDNNPLDANYITVTVYNP